MRHACNNMSNMSNMRYEHAWNIVSEMRYEACLEHYEQYEV